MSTQILDTDQKALEINLDESVYGTFAEIGAGQEVARIFFKVGAAAGTIAKTMSAYDKVYSDEIYGAEPSGRYVCASRLYKMLDHEYGLMNERLQHQKPDTNFFVFADTIAAIDYKRTVSGHGWLGLRFQLHPDSEPNDLVLHVRMLDRDNQQQASAIGTLGVNVVYACYRLHHDPEALIKSLLDGLRGRIKVDLIRLTGPDFTHLDNRYLSLLLVWHGLTEVTMFGPDGESIHGSEFLYRKSLMVARGHYHPPTLVSLDVLRSSFEQFKGEPNVDGNRAHIMCELPLDNLTVDGEISVDDYMDRARALCKLGQSVIISNCPNHQLLINYLADFKIRQLGLVIGARELLEIINEKYYENRDGRLLVAFGELFTRNIKIYVYPVLQASDGQLMTGKTLPVPEGIKFLYQYLIDSQHIVDVEDYNADLLHIFPQNVLHQIQAGEEGWEHFLPSVLVDLIKRENMFGWNASSAPVTSSETQTT
ncbi:MAG: TonB-dependent receptor [Saprospiraceae bacterium]|nr:TonB-dependent receptor [Saprospiraceae bacterium]